MNNYHDLKYLSNSALGMLLDCPKRYKSWIDEDEDRKETDAMIFGSLFHMVLLESHKIAETYAITSLNLTTKEGKAWKEEQYNKIIIKQDIYEHALMMRDSVLDHPQAKLFFENFEAEKGFYFDCYGEKYKIKVDALSIVQDIFWAVDVKTTEDASIESIQKSIAKYAYYRQDAWYLHNLKKHGIDCENRFVFIFVEKKYPYIVTVVMLDNEAIQKGRNECAKGLRLLRKCRKENNYPCYSRNIEIISLPKWALKEQ